MKMAAGECTHSVKFDQRGRAVKDGLVKVLSSEGQLAGGRQSQAGKRDEGGESLHRRVVEEWVSRMVRVSGRMERVDEGELEEVQDRFRPTLRSTKL